MILLALEVVVTFFKIGMIVIKTKNMMMITRWSTTSPVRRTRCWNLGTQPTRPSPPGELFPSLRIFPKNKTFRIAECSEVHSKLQAHFSLNLQEMYDLTKHINNIKNAIRAKQAPLKVAQTRLELRSHRPDAEATRDMPHVRLVQEVAELQNHLGRLHSKLAEAEEALKMLANTKRELKEDLTVKVTIMMMIG